MIVDNNGVLVLSSGRRCCPAESVVGIDISVPPGHPVTIYGGHDERLEYGEGFEPLTADDYREIADFMIATWSEYRDRLSEEHAV